MMNALGRHILVEFNGCSAEIMNDVSVIESEMIRAAQIAGATVINSSFHHFSPYGVSGVVVIQESHLAIHTWPEYGYAAVDLFTCGEEVDPWVSFEHLKLAFKAESFSALEMNRGSLNLLNRSAFTPQRHDAPPAGEHRVKFERNVWFTDKDENQALSLRYEGDVLFNERTPFQQVRVFQTASYGKMLAINNMIMCTERDEFHYHEMIVHPAMQMLKTAKNVLIVGGGDGGTLREVLRYPQVEKVTMVEIDEAVIRASKLHLPQLSSGFSSPKLDLIVGDGIAFVEKASNSSYDLVIVDGSDPVGPAKGLFTASFYKNCHRILRGRGVLMTQSESPMFHENTFIELNQCLKNIFGASDVHTLILHQTTYPSGMWSQMMGIKGGMHPVKDFDRSSAARFAKEQKLHYYNEDLQASAFVLPTFVRRMINEA